MVSGGDFVAEGVRDWKIRARKMHPKRRQIQVSSLSAMSKLECSECWFDMRYIVVGVLLPTGGVEMKFSCRSSH